MGLSPKKKDGSPLTTLTQRKTKKGEKREKVMQFGKLLAHFQEKLIVNRGFLVVRDVKII